MKKSVYLICTLCLFTTIWQACETEKETIPGSVYGVVADKATGEPIKSAGVELSPSGLKTITGSEGQFEFTKLDPGKYTLFVTKTGYLNGVSNTIEVKPGQQAKGDVQIEKLPPALKVVDDNRQEISTLDFGSAEDDVARSFSVFNDGTESLEWELTATADWIKSVSKTTGTLSAGATQSLLITIDRTLLNSGENKTTVHITSNNGNKQLVVIATNNYTTTVLNTYPPTDVRSTSATFNGEIITDGTPKYTERGFVYAKESKPTIDNCIAQLTSPLTNEKAYSAPVIGLTDGAPHIMFERMLCKQEKQYIALMKYRLSQLATQWQKLLLNQLARLSALKVKRPYWVKLRILVTQHIPNVALYIARPLPLLLLQEQRYKLQEILQVSILILHRLY